MSFLTATNTELIYSMISNSADITVSTASEMLTPIAGSTTEGAYLPPVFSIWQPSTVIGKGFRIVLGGIYDVAAADNVTLTYGLNTAQTAAATGTIGITLAGTGASPFPSATAGSFYAQIDINFTGTTSGGTAGTLSGFVNGFLCAGSANNAGVSQVTTGNVTMLGGKSTAGATAPAFTTWAGQTAYWFEAMVTVATAPTHFCLQQHMIYGLN